LHRVASSPARAAALSRLFPAAPARATRASVALPVSIALAASVARAVSFAPAPGLRLGRPELLFERVQAVPHFTRAIQLLGQLAAVFLPASVQRVGDCFQRAGELLFTLRS
jgi:hypothetical protein